MGLDKPLAICQYTHMATTGRALLIAWIGRAKQKQYEVAELLEIHEAHLSQILSGKRRPGLDIAVRIEDRTGIPAGSWSERKRSRPETKRKLGAGKAEVGKELADAPRS